MSLLQKLATARRMGTSAVLRKLFAGVAALVWTRDRLVIFSIVPQQLNAIDPTLAASRWAPHSMPSAELLQATVRTLPASLAGELSGTGGQRVHWLEVDGEFASWGFSAPAEGQSWPLPETRSRLIVPAGGAFLTSFTTAPHLRGQRLYPALLTRILKERFAEGRTTAYIWCRASNIASYRAIKLVGFREMARHEYSRLLGIPVRRERERRNG
jgi:hypothetical protein